MEASEPVKRTTRADEASEYLQKHCIMDLFKNITSHLIYWRPEDPKKAILEFLEKIQASKLNIYHLPSLLDESNIVSIYGMLDPEGRGYVSLKQYKEAMLTLGLSCFNPFPKGHEIDQIKVEHFLAEVRESLAKASATFFSE